MSNPLYLFHTVSRYCSTNMVTSSVLLHLHMRKQSVQSTGLAYKQENERSTSRSGRGARASYLTKFPKVSARSLLLDPNFRYLLPGNEGEKCRSLDHIFFCLFFVLKTVYSNPATTYGLQSSRPKITEKQGNTKQSNLNCINTIINVKNKSA